MRNPHNDGETFLYYYNREYLKVGLEDFWTLFSDRIHKATWLVTEDTHVALLDLLTKILGLNDPNLAFSFW